MFRLVQIAACIGIASAAAADQPAAPDSSAPDSSAQYSTAPYSTAQFERDCRLSGGTPHLESERALCESPPGAPILCRISATGVTGCKLDSPPRRRVRPRIRD